MTDEDRLLTNLELAIMILRACDEKLAKPVTCLGTMVEHDIAELTISKVLQIANELLDGRYRGLTWTQIEQQLDMYGADIR